MNPLPTFPSEIYQYVRSIFGSLNRRIGQKIAVVPNCPEPSLDTTFIEHLSHYAAPKVVAPGWAVRIDVHSLGGMRHFYDWEIADIGLLVFARNGSKTVAQKVALLQAKRLYPLNHGIAEESLEDYKIGFGTLLPSHTSSLSLGHNHIFNFTEQSKFKALRVDDSQYEAIEKYEQQMRIPVHYLLYNPWQVPASYKVPTSGRVLIGPKANGGCRIIPAQKVRAALAGKPANYSPTLAEFAGLVNGGAKNMYGWRLEHFVADLVMKCKEGHLFEGLHQDNIDALFNRRSGPISAAVAVTVERFGE